MAATAFGKPVANGDRSADGFKRKERDTTERGIGDANKKIRYLVV